MPTWLPRPRPSTSSRGEPAAGSPAGPHGEPKLQQEAPESAPGSGKGAPSFCSRPGPWLGCHACSCPETLPHRVTSALSDMLPQLLGRLLSWTVMTGQLQDSVTGRQPPAAAARGQPAESRLARAPGPHPGLAPRGHDLQAHSGSSGDGSWADGGRGESTRDGCTGPLASVPARRPALHGVTAESALPVCRASPGPASIGIAESSDDTCAWCSRWG